MDMDRMLLEDFKIGHLPLSLENILKHCDAAKIELGSDDYIAIFIYICMLELGFISEHCPIRQGPYYMGFHYGILLNQSQFLPANWRGENHHQFIMMLPGFPLNQCKLTCLKIADDIVVNASRVVSPNTSVSVLVDPKLYILDTNRERLWFQDLKKFSTLIKSNIGYPFIASTRKMQVPTYNCFNRLPREVYEYMMTYCNPEDYPKLQRIVILNY